MVISYHAAFTRRMIISSLSTGAVNISIVEHEGTAAEVIAGVELTVMEWNIVKTAVRLQEMESL